MNRALKLSFARCSAFAAVAALVQGCGMGMQSAQAPEPQQPQVRQTSNTAPADLQLVCASEAAETYGVDSNKVLPVSSSAQGNTFRVILNAAGTEAVCTIDDQGTVLSLIRT